MNEQKSPKIFKTVFGGGYQKQDVNEYIESMQAQFLSIEQTLKNTINHQASELDTLRRESDEAEAARENAQKLQEAMQEAENALGTARTDLESVRAELVNMHAELERSKAACIAAESGKVTAEASAAAAKQENAALAAELEAAKQENAKLAAELEAAKQENPKLTAELEAAKQENAGLTAELEVAKQELAALRAQQELVLVEKAALEEAVRAAEEKPESEAVCEAPAAEVTEEKTIHSEEYEELKLKAEQYDRMSSHIGAIMLKANAGAEDVMNRARADADAMVAAVNSTLTDARVRAQTSAKLLIGDLGRSLGEISRECRDEIALDLDELRSVLHTLEDTIDTKYAEINRKIEYSKEEMEQAAETLIRSATAPIVIKIENE